MRTKKQKLRKKCSALQTYVRKEGFCLRETNRIKVAKKASLVRFYKKLTISIPNNFVIFMKKLGQYEI